MWARITIFLVAALMAAAAGGAWLGHMLVQQAPHSSAPTAANGAPTAIGANGVAAIPEPPQPRVDGSLGIPSRQSVGASQDVPLVSILDDKELKIAASSASSSQGPDDLEALLIRESNFEVKAVDAQASANQERSRTRPELPPELAFAVALPADAPAAVPAWRDTLRASLARCENQRYFSKNECEQRLRVQHCDPNGGWGQVPECPAYLRNTRY